MEILPSRTVPSLPIELCRKIIYCVGDISEPMDDLSKQISIFHHACYNVEACHHALMLVSRTFNAMTTEYFLKTICVRGVGQVALLYECLIQSPRLARNVEKWTRRLDIDLADSLELKLSPSFSDTFEEKLAHVLRSTKDLTHLVLDIDMQYRDPDILLAACEVPCRSLKVLHIDVPSNYRSQFASVFRNINVLRIFRKFECHYHHSNTRTAIYDLPFLHTIECGSITERLLPFLHFPLSSLRVVRVTIFDYAGGRINDNIAALQRFTLTHGRDIQKLSVLGMIKVPAPILSVLKNCEGLQELAIDAEMLLPFLKYPDFVLRHLKRLVLTNLWMHSSVTWEMNLPNFLEKLRAHFPKLVVVRYDFPDTYLHYRTVPLRYSKEGVAPPTHALGIRVENERGELVDI